MLDAVKDHLTPKTFGIRVYVCSIVHLLYGLAFTAFVIALRAGDSGKFTCGVAPDSTAAYKTHVDKICFSKYERNYNSPLPFYGFVVLSIWFPLIVGLIYSIAVRSRVEEIASRNEPQTDGEAVEAVNQVQNQNSLYVFYSYFLHIVIRSLFGILFTILQYVVFYPSGFDLEFSCSLPTSGVTSKITKNASASQLNSTSITCENSTAPEKKLWGAIVSALNTIFALIILVEVIRLLPRFPCWKCGVDSWSCDAEFINVHFLQRYTRVASGFELEPTDVECSIGFYKSQVLLNPFPISEILKANNNGQKSDFDHLFIDLVIHTERAQHKFRKNMNRHEMFDVYMQVPKSSIPLEEVKDLFYPNKDTEGTFPRRILAIGRPGIGKTILTEKIRRDWANEIDDFYRGKIVFSFKFRWFNSKELKNMTLKTFLRYGTQLSDEKFERIFKYVTTKPEQAILILDGLDEFYGLMNYLDHVQPPDDPNLSMSPIYLFMKLVSCHFLPGATILVTSRPTAIEFYSKFHYERNVEIIGFTSDKIEEYVSKLCEKENRSELNSKIWNYINSSSDLFNLCYIPANCNIVSVIMFEWFSDSKNETSEPPKTLTEIYQKAINYFDKHHFRTLEEQSSGEAIRPSKEAIKKIQSLAFDGIARGELIFNDERFDEQMKKSGLLNSLSNPISLIETQFCFIHLTIQEFLAAKHVTETHAPGEIKEFISSHIKDGKWHLVLQFIAGLLGRKMKIFGGGHDYKDCVSAFTESFIAHNGEMNISKDYSSVLIVKCLMETGDEDIVKEACKTTPMNDFVRLTNTGGEFTLSSSDWAAVTFVCKHMTKLTVLSICESRFMEIIKLLQQRCIEQLMLFDIRSDDGDILVEPLFRALMSKCE